ncbi:MULTISPECIES: hypothetical protein [unclassified Microbulbifer]|uniref:hypothetical protein n=1 Tax=unclassified Microbulbifer TaxID=2619833 RepID=UPI0027E57656|nr:MULTISPECIES: hypothetical protein [unclassified Microbulbifer]
MGMVQQILNLAGVLLIPTGVLLMILGRLRWSRKAILSGLAFLVLGALLLVRMHFVLLWQVDACLDAGGRYNYEPGACDFQ